jgi:hypothetical protein
LASEDCASDRRWSWHCRNHAGHWQGQDGDLALAGTFGVEGVVGLWRDKSGAINMLGLAKRVRAKILQTSTSEVYGDPEVTESYWGRVNPIGVRSCYDEGERCAETCSSIIGANISYV